MSREDLQYITGFIRPTYVEEMEDGRRVASIGSKDLERVADGYACGECLAMFDRRLRDCPACGHALDANQDIVYHRPLYWEPDPSRTAELADAEAHPLTDRERWDW